jgi:hypothetical protein
MHLLLIFLHQLLGLLRHAQPSPQPVPVRGRTDVEPSGSEADPTPFVGLVRSGWMTPLVCLSDAATEAEVAIRKEFAIGRGAVGAASSMRATSSAPGTSSKRATFLKPAIVPSVAERYPLLRCSAGSSSSSATARWGRTCRSLFAAMRFGPKLWPSGHAQPNGPAEELCRPAPPGTGQNVIQT